MLCQLFGSVPSYRQVWHLQALQAVALGCAHAGLHAEQQAVQHVLEVVSCKVLALLEDVGEEAVGTLLNGLILLLDTTKPICYGTYNMYDEM